VRADSEHFHLAVDVEPVAGLDLDGGDAFGDQRGEALVGVCAKSSSSLAARVALTDETMPPPARAISS
jgi:hypothetical protein